MASISGLASNLDTNAIIDQLLQIKRVPMNKLTNQISQLEAKATGLREVSNLLTQMKSAAAALREPSLWSPAQAVSSSNETVARVTGSGAAAGGYSVSISALARAEQWGSSTTTLPLSAGTLELTLGSDATVSISVEDGDTLQTLADRINTTTASGVYATVVNGEMYLSGKRTGQANQVTIGGDAADALGFTRKQTSSDLEYSIDGGPVRTSASNQITGALPGLTIDARSTGSFGVVVSEPAVDANKVADKVEAFVRAYNDVLKGTRERSAQAPIANPATAADLAKGALYRDASLREVSSIVHGWRYHAVATGNNLNNFSSIGIDIPAVGSQDTTGALVFDREKFVAAFEGNPQEVRDLLTKDTSDGSTEGLARMVERSVDQMTRSGGAIASGLESVNDRKSSLSTQKDVQQERLDRYEATQRAMWARLETSLSKIQSLQQYMTGQFASLMSNGNKN